MGFSKKTYLNFLIQQEVVGLCDPPIELKSVFLVRFYTELSNLAKLTNN